MSEMDSGTRGSGNSGGSGGSSGSSGSSGSGGASGGRAEEQAATRAGFPHFIVVPTRWMDNDIYGHVNNVVYYAYFDTVINRYLIGEGGLDIAAGPVIGVAAESHCRYRRAVAFPTDLDAGLRVGRLGRSSVRYEIGLFPQGEDEAAAEGHFVHVFVDRATRRPTPIPDGLRAALARLLVPSL